MVIMTAGVNVSGIIYHGGCAMSREFSSEIHKTDDVVQKAQGMAARKAGHNLAANPYDPTEQSTRFNLWACGWHHINNKIHDNGLDEQYTLKNGEISSIYSAVNAALDQAKSNNVSIRQSVNTIAAELQESAPEMSARLFWLLSATNDQRR